jgi:nicotinamidase-related amidase
MPFEHSRNTAFVIIDMQHDFVVPGAPAAVPDAPACVEPISRFADACRSGDGTVVWVTRSYAADGSDVERSRRERFLRLPFVVDGTPGAELVDGLTPDPADLSVVKKRWSAFFGTALAETLEQRGIDRVVLAGVDLSRCVRATVMDAISLDLTTDVFVPGVATRTPEALNANLSDFEDLGVGLMRET